MSSSIFKICALAFSFVTCCLFAQNEIRDTNTGADFPGEVSFEQNGKTYQLQATGVATRKKFFFKIYSVASYLQKGAYTGQPDKYQVFTQDNAAKELILKFVRGLDAAKVKDAYQESFRDVLGDAKFNQLQGEISKFLTYIDFDVKNGDVYTLRWLPGGNVDVLINGKNTGSLKNVDFAQSLWSIYFGPKSVVERDRLVSLLK